MEGRFKRVAGGAGLMALGLVAMAAPVAAGAWAVQFLAVPLVALALAEAHAAFTDPQRWNRPPAYAGAVLALLLALLAWSSAALLLNGVVVLLVALLLADAAAKALSGWRGRRDGVLPATVINALADLALAALLVLLARRIGPAMAIGLALGGYVVAAGWRLTLHPVTPGPGGARPDAPDSHPDSRLGLAPRPAFAALRQRLAQEGWAVRRGEAAWLGTILLIFLAVHVGRMQSGGTWLGLVSPWVATAGDLLMALVAAVLVVLPLRLAWRKATRPLERWAWGLRDAGEGRALGPVAGRLVRAWTDARFAFSARLKACRGSLPQSLVLGLRLGLPITAFFVAINPIWGFSWYFNTESWASGFYQKMSELRVDRWRAAMVDAVLATPAGRRPLPFAVTPEGVDQGDFSFIVVGDPGEGDPSQWALVPRILEAGRAEAVKFLVVSSDVIYPAGAMSDYETHFYLPFQGFTKPIYAIPGNHDWFDALEGFNANILAPEAGLAAIEARVSEDLGVTSTDSAAARRLVAAGARLRALYGLRSGEQNAPYFELQTPHFALVAIDTGILRTLDERQAAWLKEALARSRGKFTMALVGHPRFAGGADTARGDEAFTGLYGQLAEAGVAVAMAGDTHDFEYYREEVGPPEARRTLHHIVNGGGGAYLSIGTALQWAGEPPSPDYAYYPSGPALSAKLAAETPRWKWPAWLWAERLGGWPATAETLSAIFDFNRAPFFQSFVVVEVQPSRQRVVFRLEGVGGPVRWRELFQSGRLVDPARDPDAPVELVVPMPGAG